MTPAEIPEPTKDMLCRCGHYYESHVSHDNRCLSHPCKCKKFVSFYKFAELVDLEQQVQQLRQEQDRLRATVNVTLQQRARLIEALQHMLAAHYNPRCKQCFDAETRFKDLKAEIAGHGRNAGRAYQCPG